MDTEFIIAIDQGTTSTRVLAFSLTGDILGVSQQEIEQYFPLNGWVEHDAEEIWLKTLQCLAVVLEEQREKGRLPITIGITNQRETCLLWDRATGMPVSNAIVWQDRRTAALCDSLKGHGHEEMVTEKTGLLLDSYFSATKLKWLLDQKDMRPSADKGDILAGTIESYLIYRLTGGTHHVTDLTNASRTMLCNITSGKWDPDLLALFDVPEAILPLITDNAGDFGVVSKELPGAGTPINGMIGDQQSASIGQGCIRPGMVKTTYGTGAFVLQNTGKHRHFSDNKLLTTVAYSLNGEINYAIEGSIFNAGTVTQFLRDQMGFIHDVSEIDAICRSLNDTGGVYMVPAFTGLGAPHWSPDARGIVTGLTRDTTKAQIVRAGMESIAYQTYDLMTAFSADSGVKPDVIRVDGGMSNNDWLMQYIADIVGVRIERPTNVETTAYGAAIVAGLGVGIWDNIENACQTWKVDRVFTPNKCSNNGKALIENWNKAVTLAK